MLQSSPIAGAIPVEFRFLSLPRPQLEDTYVGLSLPTTDSLAPYQQPLLATTAFNLELSSPLRQPLALRYRLTFLFTVTPPRSQAPDLLSTDYPIDLVPQPSFGPSSSRRKVQLPEEHR